MRLAGGDTNKMSPQSGCQLDGLDFQLQLFFALRRIRVGEVGVGGKHGNAGSLGFHLLPDGLGGLDTALRQE